MHKNGCTEKTVLEIVSTSYNQKITQTIDILNMTSPYRKQQGQTNDIYPVYRFARLSVLHFDPICL